MADIPIAELPVASPKNYREREKWDNKIE